MSACVCECMHVSAPEAINYIHMIFNLYNQLNKFVVSETYLYMGVAFVTNYIVTETKVIRLC